MDLPTRWCNTNEIRRCSDSGKDAEVKAQCEAYTARVLSGPKTYRNRHCLLCNNIDVPQPCYYYSIYYPPPPIPFLTMLLVWRKRTCASSEICDPLSSVCRKVFIWTLRKIIRKKFSEFIAHSRTLKYNCARRPSPSTSSK